MSDHNFVLSNQDGVLVGHMSFQVKKLFAALHKAKATKAWVMTCILWQPQYHF